MPIRSIAAAVVLLTPTLVGQEPRIDVRVLSSALSSCCCAGGTQAALPLGPVVAPITAQAGSRAERAASSITPPTAGTAHPSITHGCSTNVDTTCGGLGWPYGQASGTLSVELTVTAPAGGRHWLRILWSAQVLSLGNQGTAAWLSWRLLDAATNQEIWSETRGSFTQFPLYLDVPLDLSQPVRLRLDFTAYAVWSWRCLWPNCATSAGTAIGTMTFALRTEAPVDMPAFGVPCPSYRNTLPVAVGYEPFGLPGRDALEAVLVLVERPYAPAVLFVGASRDQFGPLPLPLDLTPAGAPGCFLLQDMVLSFPTLVAPEGIASVPLLPRSALRGLPPFYLQWLALDPVNPLGAILSNGVTVSVP